MKSWTRTLNLDDSHTLLAISREPLALEEWERRCSLALPHLSVARRRELIRLVRDHFLSINVEAQIMPSLFSRLYFSQPALTQLLLVQFRWALSHPLTAVAVHDVVRPRLAQIDTSIALNTLSELVATHVETDSEESLRKTRTVLLGALDLIGVIGGSGTGRNRRVYARSGQPNAAIYAYLIITGATRSVQRERANLASQITLLSARHERDVLQQALESGLLCCTDDGRLTAPS